MSENKSLSGDTLARACVEQMLKTDHTAHALGLKVEAVRQGHATVSMIVRQDMANGHGIAHGGMIFTLADSAFAYACNGRNQITIAQHAAVSFVAPGNIGEKLTAVASEQHFAGRSGVYDVIVTGEDGRTVALFRGNSRTVKGQHLPEID